MKDIKIFVTGFMISMALVTGCNPSSKEAKPPPFTSQETSKLETLTQRVEHDGLIPLSKLDTPMILKKGEEAYYVVTGVALFEEKISRKSTRGEGIGLSIRLIKGVTLHPSLFQSHPVIGKEMMKIDEGKLVITNKRIVFMGTSKDLAAEYKKILGVTPNAEGFQIEREGRKTEELLKMTDPVTPLVYITYIINHLSDS
ncbi:MAG: hypothetical protein HY200_07975 [Nitrospirae bacterium]|nr:hypothetical protein [Nitrospirota bacterium]MBI3594882.1 hypothetical protein [Nitrospirota bacterium]